MVQWALCEAFPHVNLAVPAQPVGLFPEDIPDLWVNMKVVVF